MRGYKSDVWEGGHRLPFIVRWPGVVKPGTRAQPMVQNIDYAPTLCEIAGVKTPGDRHGMSFAPILRGVTPSDWRTSIYYHYYEFPADHRVQAHVGVRTDRYKLIYYYPVNQWELFDLQADPHEMTSVYGRPDYAGVQAILTSELDRLRKLYHEKSYATVPAPSAR